MPHRFQRRHYIALAQAIHDGVLAAQSVYSQPSDNDEIVMGISLAVEKLCYSLKDDNPRFDRDKFVEACGLQEVIF